MTLDRYDCLEAFPKLSSEKGKIAKVTSAIFGKSISVQKVSGLPSESFYPFYPFPSIFLLILAYDSIYPILAPGLLFFPPHREAGSLVGAYVGAAPVFSPHTILNILILEI
jgi:hypothetical protein